MRYIPKSIGTETDTTRKLTPQKSGELYLFLIKRIPNIYNSNNGTPSNGCTASDAKTRTPKILTHHFSLSNGNKKINQSAYKKLIWYGTVNVNSENGIRNRKHNA